MMMTSLVTIDLISSHLSCRHEYGFRFTSYPLAFAFLTSSQSVAQLISMKHLRPPSFRATLFVTRSHHHHHHLSTTSHPSQPQTHLKHVHPQRTPDILTFSPLELLRTIKSIQGGEDDKGSRRLDCESQTQKEGELVLRRRRASAWSGRLGLDGCLMRDFKAGWAG